MKLVMKFGGTSVGSGKKLKHVAELVKSCKDNGNQIVVVTSALEGITDAILNTAYEALSISDIKKNEEFIRNITEQHYQAVYDAVGDGFVDETISDINISS